jgi:hypothetical protein
MFTQGGPGADGSRGLARILAIRECIQLNSYFRGAPSTCIGRGFLGTNRGYCDSLVFAKLAVLLYWHESSR